MPLNEINRLALGSLIILLITSSVFIYLLRFRFAPQDRLELYQRMQSWWVMVLLFILALAFNITLTMVFFALVSYLALKEYFTIIPTRRADRRIIFIAYLCIPFQYLWIGIHWYGMFIIFIPVFMFLLIPMRMVTLKQSKGFLKASGTLQWGIMLTVYCVSHIAFLGVLPTGSDWRNTGVSLIIYLVLLTQLNDVSQYICGKSFGRKKIIPEISPNKTVGGFFGGIVITTALAILLSPFLTPLSLFMATGAGLIIAIGGFVGDLILSAVKRDLGLKDTGQLLPGHGGMLDRLDSIIYTAPLFFHYIRYFYY